MDPQHRLILEVTHQALRSAGIPPEHISRDAGKNTSVYVGQFNHDNEFSTLSNLENIDAYTAQGNCTCMAANQVSSTLNLSGDTKTKKNVYLT
jgi:acyl transferase domain-containing protein